MLYFARHGQSQANLDKVFAGPRRYAPLTALGEEQAEQGGRRLLDQHAHIDHIIASPIERALRTAQIIAGTIGFDPKDIQIDDRLAEYDMGELSGQSMIGVKPADRITAPGAENPIEFQKRVAEALQQASSLPGNTLIVSHAGVGRMVSTIKLGLDPSKFYELEGPPNAQIVQL